MKSIVVLVNNLLMGGAERQAVLLAKVLHDRYNVWLVSYYGEEFHNSLIRTLEESGIRVRLLKGSHIKKAIILYSLFRNESIDIVFSYLLTTNMVGGIIGKLAGVRWCVGGIRSSVLSTQKFILQKFIHNHINDLTVFNNKKATTNFEKKGFRKEKIVYIPNGIKINEKEIKRNKKDIIEIITVCRYETIKDIFTAIKAVKHLYEKQRNITYNIIGYGLLKSELQSFISSSGADDYIKLIERPSNLDEFYKKADIYLQTSLVEGLSNTIMEAMNYSLPVITTNVGDNALLIEEGESGFLCEIGDYITMAERLFELSTNYDKRIKFGGKCFNSLQDRFSIRLFQINYYRLVDGITSS